MNKLLIIDGNSIINRAFYGIMGSKMLMTEDGTYTNAVYGFLSILFKELEEVKPSYLAVAFDLKAPTQRHKLYSEYKANRHGMPDELASQMPLLKEVLKAMNIEIIEKEGYEADDILGTLSKIGKEKGAESILLTGDRDSFQLINESVNVRIPRTKAGKTETELYNVEKINEEYGLNPIDLIEVKGLMGDKSDNIPGVPGVGEKTALSLIQKYKTIDNVYENIEEQKGKLKENLQNNKELAYLSKTLGTINVEVPMEKELDNFTLKEWNNEEVLELFKKLKFNRFIERFNLESFDKAEIKEDVEDIPETILCNDIAEIENLKKKIENTLYYYIINNNILVYLENENKIYSSKDIEAFKEIFENKDILKVGYEQKEDYLKLKEMNINANNLMFDLKIAAYILNSNISKYSLEYLADTYLNIDLESYLKEIDTSENTQINLFNETDNNDNTEKLGIYVYVINKLHYKLKEKLKETNQLDLFNNIEMPLVEVLAEMQYAGMYVDKSKLEESQKELKEQISILTKEIYDLTEEEFNINSTKQLGEILFEKLKLPIIKKNKTGYSTDADVLEKLRNDHPVIEKLLEYRQLVKLNSTYVEGLIPLIKEDGRIHSSFHQTVTATGRISSTEPNLQNIPTRIELGRKLRKVFNPKEGYVYVDADYSQIELRVLAHISQDENMIEAFNNDEDIHRQAASRVFNIPYNEVTAEERSKAKAVNFGIIYGISEFGLAGQIGTSRKKAKEYIEQYLEKYIGIKNFMDNIVEEAKEKGYVETLYNRRRYVPELQSKNYMVRQFGSRVAMNTPIQGTAADIMKIAMINVYNELKNRNLKSKLVLQIHDELLIETAEEETEEVKGILENCMQNAAKLSIPLKSNLSEGKTWYDVK